MSASGETPLPLCLAMVGSSSPMGENAVVNLKDETKVERKRGRVSFV